MNNSTSSSHNAAAIRYGVLGGLAGVVVSLIVFFANQQYASWSKWLSTAILVAAIFIGVRAVALQLAEETGSATFGKLFGAGMLITLTIAVISIAYFMLYTNVIDVDFVDNLLEISRQEMEKRGMSEEHIEKGLEISKKFMTPGLMIAFSLFGTLVFGAIAALIAAAVHKKEN